MERVYTDYTASGRQVVLNNVPASFSAFTIENLRLVFNETQKNAKGKAIDPLVSTGVKENVSSITYNGTTHTITIVLADTVPEILNTDKLTIKIDMGDSLDDISIDTSSLAKEATLGASPDVSVSRTIFGWLKSIRDFLVGIVTTNPYAKASSVESNGDTTIGMLKDQDCGLPALKEAILDVDIDTSDLAEKIPQEEAFINELMKMVYTYGGTIYNSITIQDASHNFVNYNLVGTATVNGTTYYKWVTPNKLPLEYVYTTKWRDLTAPGGDTVYQLVNDTMTSIGSTWQANSVKLATKANLDDMRGDSTTTLASTKTAIDSHNTEVVTTHPYAKEATIGSPNDATGSATLFGKLADLLAAIEGQGGDPGDLPEGLADRILLLLQFFGIEGSFEAEAKGGETTNNPVIDECKLRFAESFSDLLPSGFTMPNSVTIGTTTYTGTTT